MPQPAKTGKIMALAIETARDPIASLAAQGKLTLI
jgi:hypothetical protein